MRPPKFWDNPPAYPGFWAIMLSPFSRLYAAITKHRLGIQGAGLTVPVICIGNINLGGTGKTPTAIALVQLLVELGLQPHVVMRGYKGSLQGPVRVDEKHHTATAVGDEPLLLAAFAPTWVAKDRGLGAVSAISDGANVIVLDDGLQNPTLTKDLTLLVVDASAGFGNGRIFPSGPLREHLKDAIHRIDFIILIGNPASRKACFTANPLLSARPVLEAEIEPLPTGMDWNGLRTFAFAGIGRPEKFYDTLEELGAEIVKTRDFSDHETISDMMLERMSREADLANAQLVTTEKDAARLPNKWRSRVLTLPVRLRIEDPNPLLEALRVLQTTRSDDHQE